MATGMKKVDMKVKVDVPNLDESASKRVNEALSRALELELFRAGKGGEEAVFGDGSVKGLTAQPRTNRER